MVIFLFSFSPLPCDVSLARPRAPTVPWMKWDAYGSNENSKKISLDFQTQFFEKQMEILKKAESGVCAMTTEDYREEMTPSFLLVKR